MELAGVVCLALLCVVLLARVLGFDVVVELRVVVDAF